ncbi:UvrD-helicase domain-containing protein [Lysobacter antibioticus]|uniref:UvrD/REP helicase N-terminal domain protein n=1 Tax=Lysobacter antibioticus TaxID=84531 RepID=A0A0S2F4S3_LYSAN|nr:UvrD-helicase domain-containing protein [Lysobacter antibioticus]ALN78546.1 uvrD/REP helicase N-terminal domain protein [Lysobacter antibioticus]
MTSRAGKPDTPADIELRSILDTDTSTGFVMVSGAGSGKTTSIVKALDHLRKTRGPYLRQCAKKIACITYTEVAVSEIWGDVGNDPLFHVSTIHSFLWTAIKPFQVDIASWVGRRLDQKIVDTEEKVAAFTNRTHGKTRVQAAADIERYRAQKLEIASVDRFTYGVGSDYPKGILGHDDVIRLSTELIRSQPLIARVVGQKFPFVFVDESQDTAPDVVEALKAVSEALGPKFCLGFIGDPMQKIYTTGAGAIEPLPGWKSIEKPENFRCPVAVLNVINNIRLGGDGLTQTGGKTEFVGEDRKPVQGTAKLLVVPKDDRSGRLSAARQWLANQHADPLWLSNEPEADVKVLVIAHRMAASRLGFGGLYEAFHDKTSEGLKAGFDDGSHWSVQPFLKFLMPIVLANGANEQFEMMNLLRRFAPSLQREYARANALPTILKELDGRVKTLTEAFGANSTVAAFEALGHLRDGKMFRLDDRLLTAMAEHNATVPPTDSGDTAALQKLLHTPMKELWGYRTYIEEQSPFQTHQGVKGAEFSRVLTILDDEEGRHNQFSYGKLFGITPPSDTDESNRREGNETTFDRTRRLLYVCCSRAGKDLAVIFFADDPAAAHAAIADLGLFPPEDVHILAP